VSHAEREYKRRLAAKRRQGCLTPALLEKLKADVLQLLDGKKHPKTQEQIEDELIKCLGWKEAQIYGPLSWFHAAVKELHQEELLGSRGYNTPTINGRIEYWKVIPEPSWNW
jgi:hypothetical protein